MELRLLTIAALATLTLAACKTKPRPAPQPEPEDEAVEIDSAYYGTCGEGTAMNTVELVSPRGDTMSFSTARASSQGLVVGGLYAGDSLTVVARPGRNGSLVAQKVVNLTSLLGRWGNIGNRFEIHSGGLLTGGASEQRRHTSWKMFNARLILAPDTFDILYIGPDSMRLSGKGGIVSYRRLPSTTVTTD